MSNLKKTSYVFIALAIASLILNATDIDIAASNKAIAKAIKT